ncbi:hypothetical protein ACFLR5_00890 [Elusimicrobiota bacterium]
MKQAIITVIFICFVNPVIYAGAASDVKKGNKLFGSKRILEAIEYYRKALKKKDKNEIKYNLGTALSEVGDAENAIKNYNDVILNSKGRIKQKAGYNLGNTYYQNSDFENAVKSWKESLISDPKDDDARINLEIGLRKLEQQKKEEKKESDKKKETKKEDNKKKENDRKKEETKRILDMMEDIEKKAQEKKKFEIPRINVEKDW